MCACARVCLCMTASVCAGMCVACSCVLVCLCLCGSMCVHSCMQGLVCAHVWVCVYMCLYLCAGACVCVCLYVFICPCVLCVHTCVLGWELSCLPSSLFHEPQILTPDPTQQENLGFHGAKPSRQPFGDQSRVTSVFMWVSGGTCF